MGHALSVRTNWVWFRRAFMVVGWSLLLVKAAAVERVLRLEAPATVKVGSILQVAIVASTDAGQAEQVGFLQAEFSVDEGKTWSAICYLEKSGAKVSQPASLTPGAAGTTVKIRVRAAYRDGLAGNVDVTGAAIQWKGWWKEWSGPGTLQTTVTVVAP